MCRSPACLLSCAVAVLLASAGVASADPFPAPVLARAKALRDAGLRDNLAWELLSSLTTEVGPRPAGSDGDARAVAWAVARMGSLGLANVRAEPVLVGHWVRGEARAAITAPWPQPLVAVTLGGSVATAPGGVEAEVVRVLSLDELKALPRERVEGRIVFFDGRMERREDGSGYGKAVAVRGRGALEAAKLGAVAVVIRSVGTATARLPHTGAQRLRDGIPPIPAFALPHPDADLLDRQLASGTPARLALFSSSRWEPEAQSANVLGEVVGRERPAEVVLLAAHLDSWDLGTGAQDDGVGVAALLAVAKLLNDPAHPPRRTVRVVLFANEEMGLSGADAYVAAHGRETHALGLECDLGAFRFLGMTARVPPDREPWLAAMAKVVAPLGLRRTAGDAHGGADLGDLREAGMPVLDLHTDAAPYFDLHHGADDMLESVDPARLREQVAAYAALAWLAAEADGDWGSVPRKPAE